MSDDVIADTMKDRNLCHGKIPIHKLPVGKFANLNGSIIYRYTPGKSTNFWYDMDGVWTIEKHNHLPPGDWWLKIADEESVRHDEDGTTHSYAYMVELIEVPQKKHVDNAIFNLKDNCKKGYLTGLQYVENYTILKDYLKVYAKKKANV